MKSASPAAAFCLTLAWLAPATAASAAEPPEPPPEVITAFADWVLVSGDNRNLPFAIVDKDTAKVFVFAPEGRLLGSAPALLGFARGDDSVPGIGDRELNDIQPEERTTPAGRFVSAYGPAAGRDEVLWVDYATAISLHPVVTTKREERRAERLRSATPDDNRITYGCINVSAQFYRKVVRPTFHGTEGVFYVLPEERAMAEVFPTYRPLLAALSDR